MLDHLLQPLVCERFKSDARYREGHLRVVNVLPERNNSNHFGTMEWCLTTALGEIERIIGYNTCQVAKYDNYELGSFSEEAKHAWRDAHWEEDLQRAYDAGRKMAD